MLTSIKVVTYTFSNTLSLHTSTSTMSSSLAPDDHKDLDANLFNHDDRVVTNNESSIEGKISNNLYVFIIIKCY